MTTTMMTVPQDWRSLSSMAESLATSALIPSSLRGKPADVAVVLLTGAELGLAAMQSLRLISVIQGRPVLGADLIVGLVKRSPACRYFRLVESTSERAVYETSRDGDPEPTRLEFSLEQAKKAGLTSKDNWRSYPDAMLRARCAAALARAVYPDVVGGIYEPDEADDIRRNAPTLEPVRVEAARVEAETVVVQAADPWEELPARLAVATTEEELVSVKRWANSAFPKGHARREEMIAACRARGAELATNGVAAS